MYTDMCSYFKPSRANNVWFSRFLRLKLDGAQNAHCMRPTGRSLAPFLTILRAPFYFCWYLRKYWSTMNYCYERLLKWMLINHGLLMGNNGGYIKSELITVQSLDHVPMKPIIKPSQARVVCWYASWWGMFCGPKSLSVSFCSSTLSNCSSDSRHKLEKLEEAMKVRIRHANGLEETKCHKIEDSMWRCQICSGGDFCWVTSC